MIQLFDFLEGQVIPGKHKMRRALFATALCSSSLLSTSCLARPLYTHFLFFPKRHFHAEPKQIEGVAKQNVNIDVKDGTLHGWYFEKANAPYVVLVNHGNGGNISSVMWIAHNLLSSNVSVLLYDYRGYGKSRGLPTVETICDDGDAAYRFLLSKGYKPENIILYGQSLGCAVACHISRQHKVAGLILQSGFSSLRNVAYQRFPFLQHAPALIPDALDNAAILSQSKLPLLLIHGDRDKVVPFQNAEDLYRSAAGQKWLVVCPNSGHRLYPESDAIHRTAVHNYLSYMIDVLKDKRAQIQPSGLAVASKVVVPNAEGLSSGSTNDAVRPTNAQIAVNASARAIASTQEHTLTASKHEPERAERLDKNVFQAASTN